MDAIIKVLHIISGGDSGGAKVHLLNLCRSGFDKLQNVIGCINDGVLYEEAKESGINTVLFRQQGRMDLSTAGKVIEYVNNNGIHIVNFHGARANFLYMFMKNNMNVPGVTTVHSDYRYDFSNNALKQAVFTPLNAMALKSFSNFICVSRRIAGLLNDKGFKGNKYVVNNGVDSSLKNTRPREEIRNAYGIPEDAFVYIMAARFHPVKNHRSLIEAAQRLMIEYKDIYVLLVGSGALEEDIKDRARAAGIKENVIFTGYQGEMIDYMNAADVNVLTSFNETFPLVILEGGLAKRAAICSDVGDICDIIDDSTGFVIDPNSVDDIYHKMKQAYENRERLKGMGQELYRRVINNYTVEKFSEKYYRAYKAVISGERNG